MFTGIEIVNSFHNNHCNFLIIIVISQLSLSFHNNHYDF